MRTSPLLWSFLSNWAVLVLAAPQGTPTAAQATSTAAQTTSTATEPAKTIIIEAGNNDFAFVPHTVFANVGDTIQWNFYAVNHSVVRSAYEFPCVPINDTSNPEHLFASPIFTQQVTSNPPPSYSVTVNDTNPIWYYCSTIGSCNVQGMVGVINPAAGQSFSHQQDLAKKSPFVLQPGQEAPPEGTETPSPSPSTPSGKSSGLSKGAIAGIAIGIFFTVLLIGALFFFAGRSKTYSDILHGGRKRQDISLTSPYISSPDAQLRATPPEREDWKSFRSDRSLSTHPPSYPNADIHYSLLGTVPEEHVTNMRNHDYPNRGHNPVNQQPEPFTYSELGPGPSHEEREIHELETPEFNAQPFVNPGRFHEERSKQRGS